MGDRRDWLIAATELGSANASFSVAGDLASESQSISEAVQLGAADLGHLVGAALSQLHTLPASTCPYDASSEAAIDALRSAVISADSQSGGQSAYSVPEPYDRYTIGELIELVEAQLKLTRSVSPVVIHGDLRPQNWAVRQVAGSDTVEVRGLDRLGVGDRHRDLAVLHRYLPVVAGAEALFAFYESYTESCGTEPDLIRLDAYVLLTILVEQLESHDFTPR